MVYPEILEGVTQLDEEKVAFISETVQVRFPVTVFVNGAAVRGWHPIVDNILALWQDEQSAFFYPEDESTDNLHSVVYC